MSVLEVTGVCDRMLSFVLDPLACGAAAVCGSWADGLARLGGRSLKSRKSTPSANFSQGDLRLRYYLSIGAVQPRPGNSAAGLMPQTVPLASCAVVCPFGIDTELFQSLYRIRPDASVLFNMCLAAYIAPELPLGFRTERMSCYGSQLDVVGRVTDSVFCFAALTASYAGVGHQTSLQDGLSVGPFCVGLLWPCNSLVAVGLNDCRCLDDPAHGWVGGVASAPPAVPSGASCFLARVSPNCLAVVSSNTSNDAAHAYADLPTIVAVVCWTRARGLAVSKCRHNPALDPWQGWQIPPLDADADTQPALLLM